MKYWKEYKINKNVYYQFKIGFLNLFVYKDKYEWFINHKLDNNYSFEYKNSIESPSVSSWSRYFLQNSDNKIKIMPHLPDLPIIIKSKNKINILPGGTITYYVHIPAYINISVLKKNKYFNLLTIPSQKLSKTWLNEPSSFEVNIGYSIYTDFNNYINEEKYNTDKIIYPLKIKNNSNELFTFKSFNIENKYLSIIEKNNKLFTDLIEFSFSKNNKISINLDKKSINKTDSITIVYPDEKNKRNILEKGFNIFKI